MRTSDAINELATALAKAQAEMKNAPKMSKGNFGSYADLATLRDIMTPALTSNNIAVVQATTCTDGKFLLVTRLIHQSGQWVEGEYPLANNTDKPQIMGSALTYARRYSLAAICNLAPDEDDDGQKAQDHGKNGGKEERSEEFRGVTGDPKAKGYKTNGTTPGAIKAQDVNDTYKMLEGEIRKATSVDALRTWRKLRDKEINALPSNWVDHIAEEYERQRDEVMARIPA